MSNDKISSIAKNKGRWLTKERKSKTGQSPTGSRFFNAKIKALNETFLTDNKEYIEQNNPALPYMLRNKPVPKKYQPKVTTEIPVVVKSVTPEIQKEKSERQDELQKFLENKDKERQEESRKIREEHLRPKISWTAETKKDPNRGMGRVSAYPAINVGKLGHSQSWKNKVLKKYEYY